MSAPETETDSPSPDEVADLLRSVEFALGHGRTAMAAFVDRRHVSAIARDFDRMGEIEKQVSAMLDRLPPEPPMSPEREQAMAAFIAAVLDKRFGDGSQEAVDQAIQNALDPSGSEPT